MDYHHYTGLLFMLAFGFDDLLIVFALLGAAAVLTALTAKQPAKSTDPVPAALGDFNFPQIAEGTPQSVVFGDVWLPDWQVLWYGDLRTDAIHAPAAAGGKK